jgi:hypothetical protein
MYPGTPAAQIQPAAVGQSTEATDIDAAYPPEVLAFAARHEVKAVYLPYLKKITDYDVAVVCSDAKWMNRKNPGSKSDRTPWEELKVQLEMTIDAHAALNQSLDVYFINRGHTADGRGGPGYKGIRSYAEISKALQEPPSGGDDIKAVLRQLFVERSPDDRPLIVHILSDGYLQGNKVSAVMEVLAARPAIDRSFISFIMCSDAACDKFKPYECGSGYSYAIRGVDFSYDYQGELQECRVNSGNRKFNLTRGDYVIKCLLGCICPEIHAINMPPGWRRRKALAGCCTLS